MVKALVTMLDNGEFAFSYRPGKIPIAKEGYAKVIVLPKEKAEEIIKIEEEHQRIQEELYHAFYYDHE